MYSEMAEYLVAKYVEEWGSWKKIAPLVEHLELNYRILDCSRENSHNGSYYSGNS